MAHKITKTLFFISGIILFLVVSEQQAFSQLFYIPLAKGNAEKKFQQYINIKDGFPSLLGIPQNPEEFLQINPKTKKKCKTLILAVPNPLKNSEGVELLKIEAEELSAAILDSFRPEKIEVYDSSFNLDGFIGEYRARVGEVLIFKDQIQNSKIDSNEKSELILKLNLAAHATISWVSAYGFEYLAQSLKREFGKFKFNLSKEETAVLEKLKASQEVKFLGPANSNFEGLVRNTFPSGVEYEEAQSKNIRLFYFSKFPGAQPKQILSKQKVSEFLMKAEDFLNQVNEEWTLKLSTSGGEKVLSQLEKMFGGKEPFFTFFYVPAPENPKDLGANYLYLLNEKLRTKDSPGIHLEITQFVSLVAFNSYSKNNEVEGQNGIWFFPTVNTPSGIYVSEIFFEPLIAHFFGEFFSNFIFQHSIGQLSAQDTPWLHAALKMYFGAKYFGVNAGFSYEVQKNRKIGRYALPQEVDRFKLNAHIAEYNSHLFDEALGCRHKLPLEVIFQKSYVDLEFIDIVKSASFLEYLFKKWGSLGFEWVRSQNHFRIPQVKFKIQKVSLEIFGGQEIFSKSTPETILHDLEKDWENWTLEKRKLEIEKIKETLKKH